MISLGGIPGGSVRLLPLVLVSCATDGTSGVGGDAGVVVSVAIDPPTASVASGPDHPGTQQFTALATFDDGTTAPLDLVSWELSNDASGTIDAEGLFTASAENGALSTVVATHNGISGTAELTVTFTEVIDEGGGDPADYDGAPTAAIGWLYPPDGVSVPRNVPSLAFMWESVPGADGYRLGFTTPTTAVTVVTSDTRWVAEAEDWTTIAATNAGGQVEVEVRAVVGGEIYAADTLSLTVNRLDAQGAIYY